MSQTILEKKIMLVSDNEGVARIIKLAISQDTEVPIFLLDLNETPYTLLELDHCALIILALSSFASEPVVALAHASLACYVGRVPLLIISERPFMSDSATQIHHMDFPFTIAELNDQVRQIIHEKSAPVQLSKLPTTNVNSKIG